MVARGFIVTSGYTFTPFILRNSPLGYGFFLFIVGFFEAEQRLLIISQRLD